MEFGYTIFVISFLFLAAGLVQTARVVRANIPPEHRGVLYGPLILFVVGAIGTLAVIIVIGLYILSVRSIVTQMKEDDTEVACSQMPITDEFDLVVSKLKNGKDEGHVVTSDSGKKVLYYITKYAIAGRYMIGISQLFDPRYCWFDLTTGGQRCFDYSEHDQFLRSLYSLGISQEPSYLSLAEHCATSSCRPCTSSTPNP